MTIKQFIEKAIKGGFDWETLQNPMDTAPANVSRAVLDPKSWKAVGKVEGWHITSEEYDDISDGYRTKMHSMIDALCEGKTLEEYISTL